MRKTPFTFLVLVCAVAFGCSRKEEALTVVYSNNMIGEIRSCGCSSHDFGGLGRRATFVSGVRKRAGQTILFDGGDFFGTNLNYGAQKADLTLRSMAFMEYTGVVVGENELSLGVDYLVERVHALKLPVVTANLYDAQTDTLLFPPSRVVKLDSGLRVGVIGVLGAGIKLPLPETSRGVRVEPPQKALEREMPRVRDDVDLVVVVAHMPMGAARRLAQDNPAIDLVIAGHDARPMRRLRRFGNAFVLQTTDRGRYVGIAQATVKRGKGIIDLTGNQAPLGVDFEDHEGIVKLFQSYDMDIANEERARVSSSVPTGEHVKNRFRGGESCRTCHTDIYDHWGFTAHAHAFETLEKQNRHYDRDCTPCHSTGFYEIGGFLSQKQTPELTDVQCESCHGNGRSHSRNPALKTTGDARLACQSCHTADQTPDFQFASFWNRIKHPPAIGVEGGGK